ncbi:MAG TPA: hypothetical protein VJN67_03920 [Stellaceae bacterium]|nr:hypothetical protein [Stellaceae bacterium]
MSRVYVMWHRYVDEFRTEQEFYIGVFSSEEKARRAAMQLRKQPGFRSHPDGFQILACTIDEAVRADGLASSEPAHYPSAPIADESSGSD